MSLSSSGSTGTAAGHHHWHRVGIGLGSNLGERERNLCRAALLIGRHVLAAQVSPLVVSEPQGCPPGSPEFLNAVIVGLSRQPPDDLLAVFKSLEHRAGRRSSKRNAPRVLDCDLLVCGEIESRRRELTLPHPRLAERPFWTVPLAVAAPDLPIPGHGRAPDLVRASDSVVWRAWSQESVEALAEVGVRVVEGDVTSDETKAVMG